MIHVIVVEIKLHLCGCLHLNAQTNIVDHSRFVQIRRTMKLNYSCSRSKRRSRSAMSLPLGSESTSDNVNFQYDVEKLNSKAYSHYDRH